MNSGEIIQLEKSMVTHCHCCGFKSDTIKGPFIHGPYKFVCNSCYYLGSTWFGTKDASHFGLIPELSGKVIKNTYDKISDNTKRNILLVEPNYYSKFPPLGLLKLGAFHREKGDNVELLQIRKIKNHLKSRRIIKNPHTPVINPDIIHITSLFTWAWRAVWDAVRYYKKHYPHALIFLGGIYASILPDHAILSGADYVQEGLIEEIENYIPDYELVPDWDGSILFASRGCVRRCSFCVVPKIEGRINSSKDSIVKYLDPRHSKVYFWDNNILAAPNFAAIIDELVKYKYKIDFNQGLDARLVNKDNAGLLRKLKIPLLHLAYDTKSARTEVKNAIEILEAAGFNRNKLIFYTLFNYKDTPQDFFQRIQDLMSWKVVSYPMRFEPLNTLIKNKYVGKHWTRELLEMVARARRVIGVAGSFPPYKKLRYKFMNARTFYEAMELRPINDKTPEYEGLTIDDYF